MKCFYMLCNFRNGYFYVKISTREIIMTIPGKINSWQCWKISIRWSGRLSRFYNSFLWVWKIKVHPHDKVIIMIYTFQIHIMNLNLQCYQDEGLYMLIRQNLHGWDQLFIRNLREWVPSCCHVRSMQHLFLPEEAALKVPTSKCTLRP